MKDKKTILVVEDNYLNMELIVDLLEFNGFEVLKAIDGESALTILEGVTPNLILLDIELPGINGFEVLTKVRENKDFDDVQIIALTAQAMKEEQENIKKAGFSDHFEKPIDLKRLVKAVKDIVMCGNAD